MIFADLGAGSYFGELGLHSNSKEMARLREVREGRCFTSVWAVQNTHVFYLENQDYLQIIEQHQRNKEIEMLAYMRNVHLFKNLTYR